MIARPEAGRRSIGRLPEIDMSNMQEIPETEPRFNLGEYRRILDDTHEVIYIAEFIDKRYIYHNMLYVNKQATAVFGYDPDEFIRDPGLWLKIIHRDDISVVRDAALDTLDSGKPLTYQYRVRPKNSDEFIWVEDRIAPLHVPGIRNGIQGAISDINDRKRMEIALRENEEKYRLLFEKETDAIILIDAGTLEMQEVNEAFVALYGYSRDEVRSMKVTELAGGTEAESASLRRTLTENSDSIAIRWHRKNDGTVFPVEITSGMFQLKGRKMFCAIIRDITLRMRFETALQESENKFRDLSEKSIVGIYLIQDDTFTYVNPMFARIFGYSVDELIGKKRPDSLVSPADWPLVKAALAKRLNGEALSSHYDYRGTSKNGETISLEAYDTRTTFQGRPAVIGTVLDVTERKRAEAEREQLILDHLDALSKIKMLSGMLPICSSCKKIRDDKGYWNQIESYISNHSEAEFTHSLCPECAARAYKEFDDLKKKTS
jgi:PAS domain S-box-containing protein